MDQLIAVFQHLSKPTIGLLGFIAGGGCATIMLCLLNIYADADATDNVRNEPPQTKGEKPHDPHGK